MVFLVPLSLVVWGLFLLIQSGRQSGVSEGFSFSTPTQALLQIGLLLVCLVVGIVLHELIHALTWKLAAGLSWSTIKFGIDPKTFSPYAHCMVPMPAGPYRLGAAMPGLVTGVFPALLGILIGNVGLTFFGYLFILAATGDWLVLWLIREVKPGVLVEDHPTRAGCFVLEQ